MVFFSYTRVEFQSPKSANRTYVGIEDAVVPIKLKTLGLAQNPQNPIFRIQDSARASGVGVREMMPKDATTDTELMRRIQELAARHEYQVRPSARTRDAHATAVLSTGAYS